MYQFVLLFFLPLISSQYVSDVTCIESYNNQSKLIYDELRFIITDFAPQLESIETLLRLPTTPPVRIGRSDVPTCRMDRWPTKTVSDTYEVLNTLHKERLRLLATNERTIYRLSRINFKLKELFPKRASKLTTPPTFDREKRRSTTVAI